MTGIFFQSWSTLSRVGNSKVFKTAFIWLLVVPIVAKLFSKIQYVTFTFNGANYQIDLALPFSFQMLFFSAIFATIGQILYTVFAPSIISNYSNYKEFEDEGKGIEQLKSEYKEMLKKRCGENLRDTFKQLSELMNIFNTDYAKPKLDISEPSIDEIEKENNIKRITHELTKLYIKVNEVRIDEVKKGELFWYIRDNLDNLKPFIRFLILIFYGLAFITLGLVAIENVYYVSTQSNLDIFGRILY